MTITRNPREAALEAVAEAARQLGDAMDNCQACDAEFRALWRTLKALDALPASDGGWRQIEEAPRDGTPVLLLLKNPIPDHHERTWDGIKFVGRHPGVSNDGFDIGWSFAAPVGMGGFPDEWIEGWCPLPPPPVPLSEEDEG